MFDRPFFRAFVVLAGMMLVGLRPAFAQGESGGIQVQPVRSGLFNVKPLAPLTVVFKVKNQTAREAEFQGRVELPEGWKLVMEESAFRLTPGAETIRLVSIFVPVRALAGTYRIGYAVGASENPLAEARIEVEVNVLLVARLLLQAMEIPPFAIAGDVCRSKFLVINQGNAPLDVRLAVESNGSKILSEIGNLRLEAGQTRPVEVDVQTDSGLRKKLHQLVRIKAETDVAGQGTLSANTMTQQDIIPRVYGKPDYFNNFPLDVGYVMLAGRGGAPRGQFKVFGSGVLDNLGKHKVDLLFRGPGRDDLNLFGLQREEYRFRYDSPLLDLNVGDKSFTLTNLTNFGEYGRGAEAAIKAGRWTLRGYYERNLFAGSAGSEKAFQLGCAPADKLSLRFSYMSEAAETRPSSRIFSLQSQVLNPLANVTLEYSCDWTARQNLRPANSAFWLEAFGGSKVFSYRANIIRSGSEYNGYFKNLNYHSGELSLTPWPKLLVRALYLDQRRNMPILPYFPAFYDRTFQAGLQYQALPWLNVSLDERIHDRQDLSAETQFNYRDSTLRAGTMVNLGSFNLQNFVDFGKTYNELTQKYEKLVEYTLSSGVMLINTLTLGGYLHYRDQDRSFTGETERRLDLNFNAGLVLGRTNMDVFYRTALRQNLYRRPLSEKSFEDPLFLLNNYDMFGMSVTQRFGNGHQLSFRVQRAANSFGDGRPATSLIGLLEYSIPLGIPVSRKDTIGMLRGRVYDAEAGRKGIEGVIVKVNDLATATDRNGNYVFHGLEPGPYTLMLEDRASPRDKITLEKTPLSLVMEGGKTLDCQIGLTTGASLSGRVMVYKLEKPEPILVIKRGPDSKGPSVSASTENLKAGDAKPAMVESAALVATLVELAGANGDVFHAMTDEEGRFAFDGLRPGTYTLKVFDNNLPDLHTFEKDTFEFDLKAGAKEMVEIKVVPVVRPIQIIQQGEVTIKKKVDKD